MPISVICPGCHGRFQVSEKFAGKQGPCPKCKVVITIPKVEEVVKIHVPEVGPTDSKGRAVLKPIAREETRVNVNVAVAVAAGALVTLGLAWLVGKAARTSGEGASVSSVVLGAGALILALPLVLGGYSFLRTEEIEPFRGKELWIRSAICAVLYAALWGAYAVLVSYGVLDTHSTQTWVFAGPAFLAAGGGISYACLDLEYGNAVFHYAFYLGMTVLLRVVMGLPPV
jgi:hypothetical protein